MFYRRELDVGSTEMLTHAEIVREVGYKNELEKPTSVRELKALRAAEARRALELLQEARSLAGYLSDVWDEHPRNVRRWDA
jgi:hypothetical protein